MLCVVTASYIQGETDQIDAFVSTFVEKRQQLRVQCVAGSDSVGVATAQSETKEKSQKGTGTPLDRAL